jgi:hypothetical protein
VRKIVYLTDQPFDERNYDRFGIQSWIDRGWEVEVWDLTPWAQPRMWHDFTAFGRVPRHFSGYYPIRSGRELALRQRRCGPLGHFVDLTGDTYYSLRGKVPLARAGAARITTALGALPVPERIGANGVRGRWHKLRALGLQGGLRVLADTFFSRAAAALAAPGLVVVGGSASHPPGEARTLIRAHNFDYDIYLKVAATRAGGHEPFAVFVDQDYCFHPEFTCKESETVITPENYFPTICNGLRSISAALGLPVRIAAHPRATYRQRGVNYFQGFPVEYGRTAELIRDCAVVICHDSTAIQFAVLFGKPLIFVTTDELLPCHEGRSIARVAAELGKPPVNLNGDTSAVDWRSYLQIDAARYADYRSCYIKSEGSPEAAVWDIVINRLEGVGTCM